MTGLPVRGAADAAVYIVCSLLTLVLQSQCQRALEGWRFVSSLVWGTLAAFAAYLIGLALIAFARAAAGPQVQSQHPDQPLQAQDAGEPTHERVAAPVELLSAVQAPVRVSTAAQPPSEGDPWVGQLPVKPSFLPLASLAGSKDASIAHRRFPEFTATFAAPVEVVVRAVAAKYQPPNDPVNRHVSRLVWEGAPAQPAGIAAGRLCARVVTWDVTGSVPYLARKAFSLPDSVRAREAYEWHPAQRALLAEVTNVDARGIMAFHETAVFAPHPQQAGWTLYRSWIEFGTGSWTGQKVLALLPAAPDELLRKHVAALQTRVHEQLQRTPG